MKQTAVEWLENEFQEMCKDFGGVHSDFIVKFEQAKEMEKEQIESSYHNGARYALISQSDLALSKGKFPTPEQYYNETFKSE